MEVDLCISELTLNIFTIRQAKDGMIQFEFFTCIRDTRVYRGPIAFAFIQNSNSIFSFRQWETLLKSFCMFLRSFPFTHLASFTYIQWLTDYVQDSHWQGSDFLDNKVSNRIICQSILPLNIKYVQIIWRVCSRDLKNVELRNGSSERCTIFSQGNCV